MACKTKKLCHTQLPAKSISLTESWQRRDGDMRDQEAVRWFLHSLHKPAPPLAVPWMHLKSEHCLLSAASKVVSNVTATRAKAEKTPLRLSCNREFIIDYVHPAFLVGA